MRKEVWFYLYPYDKKGKRQLGRPKSREKDHINMDQQFCEGLDWIQLALGEVQ